MSENKSPWGSGGSSGGSNGSGGKGSKKGGDKPASPWGSTPGKPDRSPTGSGDRSADLDNVIQGFKSRVKSVGPRGPRGSGSGGGGGDFQMPSGLPLIIAGGVTLLLIISSMVFTVQGNEQASILRFGDHQRTLGEGLHFKLPPPIETKQVVNVTTRRQITVGIRQGRDVPQESLMLTGDENIVDVDFTVFYVIKDLEDYLYKIDEPDELVKSAAESVVREVIGKNDLDSIITTERTRLVGQITEQLQELLDSYESGVDIQQVQFQKTDPPGPVVDAFDGVVRAEQEAEANINDARREFNQVTLEAEGDAARIIQEAEAYRDRVVRDAEGEAARFREVYEEYRLAPRVTRQRMYLETLEKIYGGSEKIIIDSEAGSGVVPYLPLDQLQQNRNSNGGGQ